MKSIKITGLVAIMTLLLASCTTDLTKILPKKDGMWNATLTTTTTATDVAADTVVGTETVVENGSMDFKEDGTGTLMFDGETDNITWMYDENAETMTLTGDSAVLVFDVIESSNNSQSWRLEESFEFFGILNEFLIEADLERK